MKDTASGVTDAASGVADSAFYSREYNNRALVPDNERWVTHWLQESEREIGRASCRERV